jgi:catechol 2,3-dioxygenase-like lactoylglutathione lyase family enzyme
MTNTDLDTSARSGHLRCGCCGQSLPARRVTELMDTPGVYICSGCARWAARKASRLPGLRGAAHRVAHDAVGLVAGGRRGTFRSAIPILPSHDLERTIAFWATVGFEVVERFDGYLLTHANGVELHFAADVAGDRSEGEASWQPGQAFVHVKDALVLWKRLRSADVPGLGPVEEQDYGLREFVVIDPDGNRVRFGSPLPTNQGSA